MKADPVEEINRVLQQENMNASDLRSRVPADVSRILTGRVSPTWRTIQKLAGALGYTAYVEFRGNGKDG